MKLRKLEEKDIDRMLMWMHDPEINKNFLTDFSKYDRENVKQFVNNAISKENINLACVDEQDNYLGTVSLKNINLISKNAEYAISFLANAHGTGAAAFATKEILNIAFFELGLERVYLNVLDENKRANRFYKKIGFIYEGEFKKHLYLHGEFKNLRWYRMLKEEYKGEDGND